MQPPEWRSFNTNDRSIRVATLEGGDFLVNVQAGAITMAITIPPAQVAFLFSNPPSEAA
jgi:hypothetical protein